MLLQLCFALKLSLLDLLAEVPGTARPIATESRAPAGVRQFRRLTPATKINLHKVLENVLASEEYPPASLSEVARRLGYATHTLAKYNPTACHEISVRYQAHWRQRKEQRLADIGKEIREIALHLRSQGIRLTEKRIHQRLAQPGNCRDPRVRELTRQVISKLESGIPVSLT